MLMTSKCSDLVLAAVNEGLNQSRELAKQEMLKITGGLRYRDYNQWTPIVP